jgi:REP element-mobilizing transposase RayT
VRPPKAGEIEATLPHSMVGFAGAGADSTRVVLEPASAGIYHLTYACLLVPRFAEHHLTGEVADKLSEWMPILCVAFGWRLEYLAVRPEYLQWVANVPPATSPGYVMRVMRQQTSEKILGSFPRLKADNLADDFWAPGYLIMGGAQPHPSQLVKDYIKQVRQRQGKK